MKKSGVIQAGSLIMLLASILLATSVVLVVVNHVIDTQVRAKVSTQDFIDTVGQKIDLVTLFGHKADDPYALRYYTGTLELAHGFKQVSAKDIHIALQINYTNVLYEYNDEVNCDIGYDPNNPNSFAHESHAHHFGLKQLLVSQEFIQKGQLQPGDKVKFCINSPYLLGQEGYAQIKIVPYKGTLTHYTMYVEDLSSSSIIQFLPFVI